MAVFGEIAISILYSMSCLGAGWFLLERIYPKSMKGGQNGVACVASSFLLGQCLLVSVWTALGLIGIFTSKAVLMYMSVFIVVSLITTYTLRADLRLLWVKVGCFFGALTRLWKIYACLLVLTVIFYGTMSVVRPPSCDAEAFYMVLPKIMAFAERLYPQPNYSSFSQIGLFGEMHYAALFSIAGVPAAKFFVWLTSISALAMVDGIASQCGLGARGRCIAVGMALSSTAFTTHIMDGKVDIFGVALGLCAFNWILLLREYRSRSPMFGVGFIAGWSCIAKFSNIPVVLSGLGLLYLWNRLFVRNEPRDRNEPTKPLRKIISHDIALSAFGVIIAILPHIIKNYVLFGEPFAPFLFLSHGSSWVDQAWFSPEATRFILATYPVALTFGIYPMQIGNLSVLILAFLPLAIFLDRPKQLVSSALTQVSVTALMCLAIWMVVRPSVLAPRYILATLFLFIPLAARSAEHVLEGLKFRNYLKVVVISALFSAMPIGLLGIGLTRLPHVFFKGQGIAETFTTQYSPALNEVNLLVQPGERVYVAGYYTFSLNPELLQGLNVREESSRLSGQDEVSEKWKYLFARGFSYMVIQKPTHASYLDMFCVDMVPSWMNVRNVFEDQDNVVFELRARDRSDSGHP